jgi:hypothetical protein
MTSESANLAFARRNAEEARTKLWATFEEIIDYAQDLQRRLEPSHLARDAWEAAKSKGADMAEDAVDAVRSRPVAATGIVAALALFLAREPLIDAAGKLMNGTGKKKARKKGRKSKTEKGDND